MDKTPAGGKKQVTEDEAKLYAYVMENAQKVVDEIIGYIQKSPLNEGGMVFISGPVNSGKSIVVCKLAAQVSQSIGPRKYVVVQPHVERPDVSEGEIFSRSGLLCEAKSFGNKADIEELFHSHSLVIIDEVQFIPYELQSYFLKEATQFVERGGWLVNVGLLYTSTQLEFLLPSILSSRAKYTYELVATCQMCGRRNAKRNQRLINGRSVSSDAPELLPPSDKVTYEPRCLDCLTI